MPSGHWELLEPGHGDVWRWRLTPAVASKQVQSARRRASGAAFFLASVKWRERSSSGRRGDTDSPWQTCGFAVAVNAPPSSGKRIFYRRQRKKQSRKDQDHWPLATDHPAVACAKAADKKADLVVSRLRFVVP